VLLRKIVAFQALAIFTSMEFAKQAPKIDFFRNSTHSETASRKSFRPPRAAQEPSVLASKIRRWKSALRRGISALQPAAPLASSTV
jgi:hypothetical protein